MACTKLIQTLKSAKHLEDIRLEYDRLTKRYSASDVSLRLTVEVFKCLNSSEWTASVDPKVLTEALVLFNAGVCPNVSNEYHNYLGSITKIYKFILGKNVDSNIADQIFNMIFDNIQPNSDYSRFYWSMYYEYISTEETIKSKQLSSILGHTIKLIDGINLNEFCKSYLYWIVRKLFSLFNHTEPQNLGTAYEKICTRLCEKTNEKSSEISPEVFKAISLTFLQILQNNLSSNYQSNETVKTYMKFATMLFSSSKDYGKIYELFSEALPLFMNKPKDFDESFCKCIEKLFSSIIPAKSCKTEFDEYIAIVRTIMNVYLTEWIKSKCKWNHRIVRSLLDLILRIAKELKKVKLQYSKCDACKYQSGIHDALQILTFVRQLAKSIERYSELVPHLIETFKLQTEYVLILSKNGCPCWDKLWDSTEKNWHNEAVRLHVSGDSRQSLSYFNIYFSSMLKVLHSKPEQVNLKSLSKVYYNCAVCHLELMNYKEATMNSYIALMLNSTKDPERERNSTLMKCVVTAKNKAQDARLCCGNSFKDCKGVECECRQIVEDISKLNSYDVFVRVKDSFMNLLNDCDFRHILLEELENYSKLWFSALPVIGICKTLSELYNQSQNINSKIVSITSCAKAVTILSIQSNKLNNPLLAEFVRFTTKALETSINKHLKNVANDIKILLKLLYGNSLRALFECNLMEKIQKEPPPAVSMTADTTPKPPHHLAPHPDDVCDVAPAHQSLTLTIEGELVKPLVAAVGVWKEIMVFKDLEATVLSQHQWYVTKSVEIMEITMHTLALRSQEIHAITTADVAYFFADLFDERATILRTVGFILERMFDQNSTSLGFISKANNIVKNILQEDKIKPQDPNLIEAVFEYLLNLSVHYLNCNSNAKAVQTFVFVHNKILHDYLIEKKSHEKIKLAYCKLIAVQSLFLGIGGIEKEGEECISLLTNCVNAFVISSNITAVRLTRQHPVWLKTWLDCGLVAAKISTLIGLPRRARVILKSVLSAIQMQLLPQATAGLLLLLAKTDLDTERYDDCKVKLDSINYIIEEYRYSMDTKVDFLKPKDPSLNSMPNSNHLEAVLDASAKHSDYNSLGASPVFRTPPFAMPSFIDHKKTCACTKCMSFDLFNLVLGINHLKAVLEFKIGSSDTTLSFFDGNLKLLNYIKSRIEDIERSHLKDLKHFSHASRKAFYERISVTVVEFYIDAGFYFVVEGNRDRAIALNKEAFLDSASLSKIYEKFIVQRIYEQKLFLDENLINKINVNDGLDLLDEKLKKLKVVTPEKLSSASFKTPANIRARPAAQTNRFVKNSALQKLEFNLPSIKVSLDFDDKEEKQEDPKHSEDVPKTPAPRIRNKRLLCMETETPKSRTSSRNTTKSSSLKTKSSLIRSTSPGPLDQYEFKKSPTVQKRSTRSQKESTSKK